MNFVFTEIISVLSVDYRGAQPGSLAMRDGGWVGGDTYWHDRSPLGVRADDAS